MRCKVGGEASWLCYDQVATSQIGNEEKKCRFLYFTFICACQIVHLPFQRHPDSGMQSSKAGYEVVVKDHDLVDINTT